MKNLLFASLAVLAMAFMPKAPQESYSVNAQESSIGWVGKKVTGQHNGTIKVSGGKLEVSGGKITGGEFTLDMNSIICEDIKDAETNKKFVGHLRSDDFFSVDKHPTGKFAITKATHTGKKGNTDTYKMEGNLTLKGISKPVAFDAEVSGKGKKMTAKAAFKINRTQWDIKFRSGSFFENLGDKMIYDDIELSLNTVFEKGK